MKLYLTLVVLTLLLLLVDAKPGGGKKKDKKGKKGRGHGHESPGGHHDGPGRGDPHGRPDHGGRGPDPDPWDPAPEPGHGGRERPGNRDPRCENLRCEKPNRDTYVCGSDGETYRSACHLIRDICKGKIAGDVEVAFLGRCQHPAEAGEPQPGPGRHTPGHNRGPGGKTPHGHHDHHHHDHGPGGKTPHHGPGGRTPGGRTPGGRTPGHHHGHHPGHHWRYPDWWPRDCWDLWPDYPGHTPCRDRLGVEDGQIPGSNLTASSEYTSRRVYYGARNGRLNHQEQRNIAGAWVAQTNDGNQWIQAALDSPNWVTGVLTQGRHHDELQDHARRDHWVTEFKVQYSDDGYHWRFVRHRNYTAGDVIFDGNTDQNTVVTNIFPRPVRASHIRIVPTAWHDHISMRFELLGCKDFGRPKCTATCPIGTPEYPIQNVCGSDDRDYPSACALEFLACITDDIDLVVDHEGRCL